MKEIYNAWGIEDDILKRGEEVLEGLRDRFEAIDATSEANQIRVLQAMRDNRVSEACLHPSTGYGYNDLGRDTLEKVYAQIFGTEDALVRPQIASGTHALSVALSANVRPGDELLSPVGRPYDTLEEVIGIRPSVGSLAEYGATYREVDLLPDGSFDFDGIAAALTDRTKLITIQRSKGYRSRPTLSVSRIGELIDFLRSKKEDLIILVDNCYGEFAEAKEPGHVGADMVVGSLIKNPGGGLAPAGGYIAGSRACVERSAVRLTAPGIGREVGASLSTNAPFYQGLFMAPTVTASAMKGAIFAAALYESYGFQADPHADEARYDIIQAITFGDPEALKAFCRGIQAASPIDSFVTPEPWAMPGYADEVIMAAGTFIQGASIELSADGPLRPPYTVYYQGGLTWPHAKAGILMSAQFLKNAGQLQA